MDVIQPSHNHRFLDIKSFTRCTNGVPGHSRVIQDTVYFSLFHNLVPLASVIYGLLLRMALTSGFLENILRLLVFDRVPFDPHVILLHAVHSDQLDHGSQVPVID